MLSKVLNIHVTKLYLNLATVTLKYNQEKNHEGKETQTISKRIKYFSVNKISYLLEIVFSMEFYCQVKRQRVLHTIPS